jgi:flagellar FliL protein
MRYLFLLISLMIFSSTQPLWAEEDANKEQDKAAAVSYYQIKPSLVANLASGGKYLRCDVQLMTKDESLLETLNLHAPAIRHTLLLLLSEQNGKELKTSQGKEALREKALSEINKLLETLAGQGNVETLFFTTFFIQ